MPTLYPHLWKVLIGLLALTLVACGKNSEDPELFLPRVMGVDGTDLEAQRARLCRGVHVQLEGDVLTPENFSAVFNCANYDQSLEPLRPLLSSPEFPNFLKNVNLMLASKEASKLEDSVKHWLAEGPEGSSRAERLLPVVATIVKNPAFQDGLPLVSELLNKGEKVWKELLPPLGDLVYQDRYPHNWTDFFALFGSFGGGEEGDDYSRPLKDWARFLTTKLGDRSVAAEGISLLTRVKELDAKDASLIEFLDQMNEKGVFEALYLDNGTLRGEAVNPKLNADAEEDEQRDGLTLTPAERQARAHRRLFTPAARGEQAPIVQLVGLVKEFHQPHPEFVPALARWLAGNGPKVSDGISEYVVRTRLVDGLSSFNLDAYLNLSARKKGITPSTQLTREEFTAFLREAFAAEAFVPWLDAKFLRLNGDQLGERNAETLRAANLGGAVQELYREEAVAAFGATLFEGPETLALSSLAKRFSNLHRSSVISFHGASKTVEEHLVDLWWEAARRHLGENVVLEFVVKLAQTLSTQMAEGFGDQNLAYWYFTSPYGNPGTTEAVAGYAVKELDLLPKYYKHRAYLKGALAEEIFQNEDDRRAFRLLVDQIPHIWLYVKSGMARSGNDLTRALASRDDGFLIRRYVDLLVRAHDTGILSQGVSLLAAYQNAFPADPAAEKKEETFERRRRISKGADSLKRVLRSLLEPTKEGDYTTSTLSRVLVPVSSLLSPERQGETERFVLTSCHQILDTPDEKINSFLGRLLAKEPSGQASSETLKATAETLRDPAFPVVLQQLNGFFQDHSVKPALDFFAKKVDDGSLERVLLFVRRVLGLKA